MASQFNLNSQMFVELAAEQLKELGDYNLGLKLLVKCHEATYIAVCHHVIDNAREIVLEQVTSVDTGISRFGLVIVFYQDIISITVIGVDREARKRLWKGLYGNESKSVSRATKQILPPSLNDGLLESFATIDDISFEPSGETPILSNFCCEIIRPTTWKIINAVNEDLYTAVSQMKEVDLVSLSGCGLDVGRRGALAWLCMQVGDIVYLFDIVSLGVETFMKCGVKEVLEDMGKVKVVHNGRRLEDYLHHQHKVNLKNVFDTQASDIYVNSQKNEKKPQLLLKSLPSLLNTYLGMSQSAMRKLLPAIEEESMWLERPLPEALVAYLVHSVIFLKEIREQMLKEIYSDLDHVNQLFMSSLRDKPPLRVDHGEEQIVPPEIQNLLKEPSIYKTLRINYTTQS